MFIFDVFSNTPLVWEISNIPKLFIKLLLVIDLLLTKVLLALFVIVPLFVIVESFVIVLLLVNVPVLLIIILSLLTIFPVTLFVIEPSFVNVFTKIFIVPEFDKIPVIPDKSTVSEFVAFTLLFVKLPDEFIVASFEFVIKL